MAKPRERPCRHPLVFKMRPAVLGLVVVSVVAGAGPPWMRAREARAGTLLAQRASPLEGEAVAESGHSDIRRQGSDQIVSGQRELELSSELVFVTSRLPTAGVPQLYFTDLGLWRARVAFTLIPGLRLTAAATFLPKQPATLDEPFWQAASAGARVALADWAAFGLDGEYGNLLAGTGHHGSAAFGLQLRTLMNRSFMWEGRVGAMGTRLWPAQSTGEALWFAEAGAAGQFQVCWGGCREHNGATWLGIDFAVPVYRHPGSAGVAQPFVIDPRTRLGVTVGSFFNVSNTWDFYGTVSWIDRGDPDVPGTELPVLDGGFDQVQVAFGLIAHWWLTTSRRPEPYDSY